MEISLTTTTSDLELLVCRFPWNFTDNPLDQRENSVLAFQKLWNLNNPNDKIAEDGQYGPNTEKRLQKSPIEGFAKDSTCGKSLKDFDAEYEMELVEENKGTVAKSKQFVKTIL